MYCGRDDGVPWTPAGTCLDPGFDVPMTSGTPPPLCSNHPSSEDSRFKSCSGTARDGMVSGCGSDLDLDLADVCH